MAASVMIAAYLIPGVRVGGFLGALWVALFLGIVNALIRPILIIITLPINILTLGLFTFVINAVLILLASAVIESFYVNGFWTALFFSVVLSLMNHIMGSILQRH